MGPGFFAAKDAADCIVAVARHHDRQCFVALFHHFAPRLKAYLLRLGLAAGTAEDLAQETMLTVWRKAAQFDPCRATPAAWIFTIARNLRIDALRREHRQRRRAMEDGDEEAPTPEHQVNRTQIDDRVREALGRLPSEQAELLRLSYFEERSHAQIADDLHIPLGTVKSRLRRAAAHLRQMLEGVA